MSEHRMDPELKAKWVKALRSGEYEQCRNVFRTRDSYCCIAVGYRVAKPLADMSWLATDDGQAALGLTDEQRDALVGLNDDGRRSFSEIANYIEENL